MIEDTKKNTIAEKMEEVRAMQTEVFDETEIAQLHAAKELEAILAAHAAKMKPETHPDFDGESCIKCGIEIPERAKDGRIRCYDCQTAKEKYEKMHPGRTMPE